MLKNFLFVSVVSLLIVGFAGKGLSLDRTSLLADPHGDSLPTWEEQNRIAAEAFEKAKPQPCIGLDRKCFTAEDYADSKP